MKFFISAAATAAILTLSACGDHPGERGLTGAAIGAGIGATAGAIGGAPGAGAAAGAAAGGLVGVLTDRSQIDLGNEPRIFDTN